MPTFFDLTTDHAQELLLDETSSLILLLDKEGTIIEGNKSLNNFLPDKTKNDRLFLSGVIKSRKIVCHSKLYRA